MAKNSNGDYNVKLEVTPDRIVSNGSNEITLKCSITDRKRKPVKQATPVTFEIKKHRVSQERKTHKGTATFRFKPLRPTAKTRVTCSTPYGEQTAWLIVDPTPKQYIVDMLQAVLLACFVAFVIIKPFIIQTYFIPSGSMEPTLYENDRLIGAVFTYRFRDPRPGEVIVFKQKDKFIEHHVPVINYKWKSYTNYIKRVIAVGGDTIEVRDLTVYVNGTPLDEPYIERPPFANFAPFEVPENSFFMMGDNRNNSRDSRFWGALERERVVSKALFRFWPLDRVGVIKQDPLKFK